MLTPKFEISQCDLFVKLKIHAPYTSVAAVELVVIDNTVSFYAKPYLLKYVNKLNYVFQILKYEHYYSNS